jgi:hypothetical protein
MGMIAGMDMRRDDGVMFTLEYGVTIKQGRDLERLAASRRWHC